MALAATSNLRNLVRHPVSPSAVLAATDPKPLSYGSSA